MVARSSKQANTLTVAGIGYIGDYDGNAVQHPLYFRWTSMIYRCYNPRFSQYRSYGAKGVFIEDYLLSFANYASFVSTLPHYKDLIKNPKVWQIDKDINGGKCYSRATLKIIKMKDNIDFENAAKRKPVTQVLNDGTTIQYKSLSEAEQLTGICKRNISRSAKTGIKANGFQWRFV